MSPVAVKSGEHSASIKGLPLVYRISFVLPRRKVGGGVWVPRLGAVAVLFIAIEIREPCSGAVDVIFTAIDV
jgi:hypothetical protein